MGKAPSADNDPGEPSVEPDADPGALPEIDLGSSDLSNRPYESGDTLLPLFRDRLSAEWTALGEEQPMRPKILMDLLRQVAEYPRGAAYLPSKAKWENDTAKIDALYDQFVAIGAELRSALKELSPHEYLLERLLDARCPDECRGKFGDAMLGVHQAVDFLDAVPELLPRPAKERDRKARELRAVAEVVCFYLCKIERETPTCNFSRADAKHPYEPLSRAAKIYAATLRALDIKFHEVNLFASLDETCEPYRENGTPPGWHDIVFRGGLREVRPPNRGVYVYSYEELLKNV